jgi:SPP1 family predicted phage head-tail adaptor
MISKLRHRIQFLLPISASDGAGGIVNNLQIANTCWAQIVTRSNDKDNILSTDGIDDTIRFRIRLTEGGFVPTKRYVISHQSNQYLISSYINENDLNQYWLITSSAIK